MYQSLNISKIILFTSCKGGVGKSTVCANLAMTLAQMGKRVLMIDCDFGSRCLDLIAGIENSSVYDIGDVVLSRVPLEKAIVKDKRNENLSFLAAMFNPDTRVDPGMFQKSIGMLARADLYDYIFIDTPGGIGEPLALASSVSHWAFIVTNQTISSIRAADKTADFLYRNGVHNLRLIINKMTGKNIKEAKQEVIGIIDSTSIKLIGVIPYDKDVIISGNKGVLVDSSNSKIVKQAFENLANRVNGNTCILFSGIKKIHKLR